ncbi:MAG: cobalamin-dependent protein [Bacteroidota bacterium]|nr:cobalamin-dependent protein [Bacteroidota bacterium]
MRILFVRPDNSPETIGLQHLMVVEPLELEILYTLIREHDTAEIIDMLLEKRSIEYFIRKFNPDVFCVTGYITNVSKITEYCRIAKAINPEITTIVGGVHCEVCPEDFESEHIDFRVVRNAAVTFTGLLNHIEYQQELPSGIIKKGENVASAKLPPFNFKIPVANRQSVKKYRGSYFYIFSDRVALIKTSFGCPFNCSFCFCTVITHGKYFQRDMQEVMQELEQLEEKEIYIVDDDFLADKTRLELFIQEVKKRKIAKNYLVYGRADFIASNAGLMKELAGIGLKTVIVGFESFFEKDLEKYNKNTNAGLYKQTMQVLKVNKIDCFATMIVSPDWDKADFKKMVQSVKELGIHYVNLQPLTPLPKTNFESPVESLLIKRTEYEKWDLAHVSIQPTKMSVAEYYREILKAYNSILFQPSILLPVHAKTFCSTMPASPILSQPTPTLPPAMCVPSFAYP